MSIKNGGKLPTESYKGVRDFYPEDQAVQNYLFSVMRSVAQRFGYEEYHASILEPAELYRSKGAENEEIINEQAYSFTDRGEREVTLRPEMTPTVARMVAAKRRELGFPLRLYSIPNVFRYERPQRGRLREHWQFNIDLFGSRSTHADAEIIQIAHALLTQFGATQNDFQIRIGSRAFLDALIAELNLSDEKAKAFRAHLDRRLKMPESEFAMGLDALGVPIEKLSSENIPNDVAEVLEIVRSFGIENAVFAPDIVRGFDYYTGIVFEVFDTNPQNTRALFGGGRYDNLLALFDSEEVPGVGFGAGDVTLRDFLDVRGLIPAFQSSAKVYLALADVAVMQHAEDIASVLRQEGVHVAIDFGEKKLGDQIKQASKHVIPYVVVIGETEWQSGVYTIRELATGQERVVNRSELISFFVTL